MNRTRSHSLSDACVGCARVLQSMKSVVLGMSMKALLQFGAAITNPAGIGLVGSELEPLRVGCTQLQDI